MLSDLLKTLGGFLPERTDSLPKPSVSVVSVTERTVGLGNRVGTETRGSFAVAAIKGNRLDAVVRFEVWANQPDKVNEAIALLHDRLLSPTAKKTLREAGILRLAAAETSLAEFDFNLNAWGKTCDYQVLYEFTFPDADDAESLIARIPININGEFQESTVVTDSMVRWDNQSAPKLVLRGRSKIARLSALVSPPGAVLSGSVTLTRTFNGAVGAPTTYPTLTDFLNAIASSNPTNRHAQVIFPSLSAFLNAFAVVDKPDKLKDVPGLYQYQSKVLSFEPAIGLMSASDRLELAYAGNSLNQVAVVYLQATKGESR